MDSELKRTQHSCHNSSLDLFNESLVGTSYDDVQDSCHVQEQSHLLDEANITRESSSSESSSNATATKAKKVYSHIGQYSKSSVISAGSPDMKSEREKFHQTQECILVEPSDEEDSIQNCSQQSATNSSSGSCEECDSYLNMTKHSTHSDKSKENKQVSPHDDKDAQDSDSSMVEGPNRETPPAEKPTELNAHWSSDKLDLICPFCDAREESLYRLEFHVSTMHPDTDVQMETGAFCENLHELDGATVTDIQTLSCPLCDLEVDSEIALGAHLKILHGDILDDGASMSCPLCDFTSRKEDDLRRHMQGHHNDTTYFGVSCSSDATESSSHEPACPICSQVFGDTDLLTSHVESHFGTTYQSGAHSSACSSSFNEPYQSKPMDNVLKDHQPSENVKKAGLPAKKAKVQGKCAFDKQYEQNLERAVARGEVSVGEYHEQRGRAARRGADHVDDGQTRVQGVIQRLHQLFNSQARLGQEVRLCSPTDHFAGSYGDKGWGCGYRNFQMMLSCLLRNPNYAEKIFPDGQRDIPSIPRIQEMIESAWKKGFDLQGCQQLKGRLSNTRKWIGATEIVALLSSLRIKCHLADFHAPSAPDGTHPRLLEWICDYFSERSGFKPPLYLQHQGHSRTVVGVEKEKGAVKLLLFDPGTPSEQMAAVAQTPMTWKQMKTFRRSLLGFKSRQYQVVAVTGLLSESECQQSKILKSERVV
ncbi:zinc finger-containing ubiquitin peptidase 1 isoform X2 [Aplysia californica]|nr:zinc finger-containing ubiquitin peptidase 1 isoform X2 [Aplysia californica]